MRTKTLVIAAAIAAVGAATSMAQVFSVNVVGYVNVSLARGFNLVANPLSNGDNKLETILPSAPDGTKVFTFSNGRFDNPVEFVQGLGWDPAGKVLAPGTGAFIQVSEPTTLTFVGEVVTGSSSVPLVSGFNLIASTVPIQATLGSTGNAGMNFPAADGDKVFLFDSANQRFQATVPEFIQGLGWDPVDPTIGVGQAFFIFTSTARSWNRTFTIQ
jgi:hypothetical protein